MELICKRCNHRWKTRTENTPSVCPKCKSMAWDKALNSKEITELLNERCRKIIDMSENVDYCTMAPQLLLTVMVAFAEAEKVATIDHMSMPNVILASKHLDIIQQLVVAKVIPKELYRVCHRLIESYMRDTKVINKSPYREKDYQQNIVDNWDKSILSDFLFVGTEVELPDLDRIDILAKEENGRDVIIELKKGAKDGYRQLRAYGYFYENPRLINISEKPVINKKKGIEYRTFAEIHGKTLIPNFKQKQLK